jgi:cation diffusion facilitator CzcD-associated flavoprotein CzcO
VEAAREVGAVVIGAGFSGIGASIALQRQGIDHVVLEAADDVGGTWRDNQYPGCRCDVPSHLYSFSFAPNPEWSTTYAAQPEIWAYLRDCAERYGVMERCRFGHEVLEATWDDEASRWIVSTTQGRFAAATLIGAYGPLSSPKVPDIEGLDRFGGRWLHSAQWVAADLLEGQRVAVIGTGASAVQIVPQIQPNVAHLTVFQRTPPWVLPHTNRDIRPVERAIYRRVPAAQRAVRTGVYWLRELFAIGLCRTPRRLETVRKIGVKHLESQVTDPVLRQKLLPSYTPGCKRITIANDYYPAIGEANVSLETAPISHLDESGIVMSDGRRIAADTVVLATGFHVTDHPMASRIRGRDGRSIAEVWERDGMQAYLGTTVTGFPNCFLLAGPNTGIGHTSLVVMIEAQLRYVAAALRERDRRGAATVEVTPAAQAAFVERVSRRMVRTVWTTGGCRSWYLDSHGRNTTLWPDFTWRFVLDTRRFNASGHRFGYSAGSRRPEPAQSV